MPGLQLARTFQPLTANERVAFVRHSSDRESFCSPGMRLQALRDLECSVIPSAVNIQCCRLKLLRYESRAS